MKIFSRLLDFNSFESFSGLSLSQKEISKGIPLRIGVCHMAALPEPTTITCFVIINLSRSNH